MTNTKSTTLCPDTRRRQVISTCLLVAAWLYANISALELLYSSFTQASSFNLMLMGVAIAFPIVQLVRDRQQLVLSAIPVLRVYPLLLMLGVGVSAIALQWFVDIPQLSLLLFALGTYGLWGLFTAPLPWRKGLPIAILIACILPLSTPLSSGLGLPARLLTARVVEQFLSTWHVSVISSQDIIILENGIAHVDSPCSGLKSLWTGMLFLLAVTWLEGRFIGMRWLLVCASSLLLLVSFNTVRVLVLVVVIHLLKQPEIAAILHVPLGLLGFVCACALTWLMLQFVPKYGERERGQKVKSKKVKGKRKRGRGGEGERDKIMNLLSTQSGLLVVLVVAMALIAQVRSPQEIPPSIASLQFPKQMTSEILPLTAAEKSAFDNHFTAPPEKRRFAIGNLSGSMLLVSSASWGTHHAPELCFAGNGFKVDRIETKQLTSAVLARWFSLQEGKFSATYWLQSSQQTTDDFLSRIWSDVTRRQKNWVLVSILFDSPYSSDRADVRSFVNEIHDAIARSFKQVNKG